MIFQIRTVPGQTVDGVRADLRPAARVDQEGPSRARLRGDRAGPGHRGGLVPGPDGDPARPRAGDARWPRATGWPRVLTRSVGGWGRLGNVGDGNILGAAGIPSRAVRGRRHPHLQGVADARRARAARGSRHRGPRHRLRDVPPLRLVLQRGRPSAEPRARTPRTLARPRNPGRSRGAPRPASWAFSRPGTPSGPPATGAGRPRGPSRTVRPDSRT